MKVGLIVEGNNDEVAIEKLCKKIGITPEIRKQRGRINVRKACSYAKDLIFKGCEKVIILSDAHCNKGKERERLREVYKFCSDLKNKIHICIVVNELESWLIADAEALSSYIGCTIKTGNPEEVHDAKGHLRETFKKVGKVYYTTTAREIAERIDIYEVLKKCPSFGEFYNRVKDC